MPLYRFVCPKCKARASKMLEPGEQAKPQLCKCGGRLRRSVNAPSSQVNEILDNGLMPRKLERLADAERIYRDHSKADPRKNQ